MDKRIRVLMAYEIPRLTEDINKDSIRQKLNNYVKNNYSKSQHARFGRMEAFNKYNFQIY